MNRIHRALFFLLLSQIVVLPAAHAATKRAKDAKAKAKSAAASDAAAHGAAAQGPAAHGTVATRPPAKPAPPPEPVLDYSAVWSTRGGATLGSGAGIRANLFAGNHFHGDGYAYLGVEAFYLKSLSREVDLGFGLRVFGLGPGKPPFALGVAPGLQLRYNVVRATQFALALEATAVVPLTFIGLFGGFGVGISVEPAVLMSYFVRPNMEVYGGLISSLVPSFLPATIFQWGIGARAGFAYTFKGNAISAFANIDVAPGFYAFGGFPTLINNLFRPQVAPLFGWGVNAHVGAQFRI